MKVIILQAIITLTFYCYGSLSDTDFGGIITIWPKDPGLFVFVNNQNIIKEDVLLKPIQMLKADFNINIKLRNTGGRKFELKNVPAELKGFGANGGIYFINDPAFPIMLAATEDGWGLLNMAQIVADAPDSAKLNRRIQKLTNRLFANIHGVADPSMMPACVMKHAVGLTGVDSLVCATFSPEANSKITAYLNKAGYKQRRCGTYYDACEEGWAPAPTNAVQKKIWDKVHTLPTKPLVILPESQRKKK